MNYSSPGVPPVLATAPTTSATPILTGPPIFGTSSGTAFTTETVNIWPQVLVARGVAAQPFTSHTPIVYGPVIFSGVEG